ncbi:MAG: methyltransferase domain-containing protein [Candidatus Micrarchaeia archaeon]
MKKSHDVLYHELAEFYEPFYRKHLKDSKCGIGYECALVQKLFKKSGNKVKRVLDAGCGTGIHCFELEKRGFETVGFDLAEEMLVIARRRAKETKSNAKFFQGNMVKFDFGKFDAVISMHNAVMHLPSAKAFSQALESINRTLPIGGVFVVDFSDYERMQEKGEFPEVFADRLEKGKTSVMEISENAIEKKKGLLRERNTYFSSKDGTNYKKLETSGTLILLSVEKLDKFLPKAGFRRIGAIDLETGGAAGKNSVELFVGARKIRDV